MMSKHELVNVIAAADAAINAENFDALFDDLSRQREELDSLVETTSSSLLHLESVDRQLGIVRVHTRSDGWRQNIARRCTSTGSGGPVRHRLHRGPKPLTFIYEGSARPR